MTDELIAAAEIGEQARSFMESELYKVMLGIAEQEAQLAKENLAEVDPTDHEKIRTLQNSVKVSRWFTEWLNELVSEGDNAMAAFKQQQES